MAHTFEGDQKAEVPRCTRLEILCRMYLSMSPVIYQLSVALSYALLMYQDKKQDQMECKIENE